MMSDGNARLGDPDHMLEVALNWARRGIKVFPCTEQKRPYTRDGFKSATSDPDQVRAYWTQHPGALVGSPTGEINGFFVVDLDVKAGIDGPDNFRDLELKYGEVPDSATSRTRSGGVHKFFAMPKGVTIRSNAGKIAPGIDIRGTGGYVIMPGSPGYEFDEEHTKKLAPAPAWLLDLVAADASKPSTDWEAPNLKIIEGGGFDLWFDSIIKGSPLHDSLRDLAAHLAARGMPPNEIGQFLYQLMHRSAAKSARPAEWQERLEEIPRLVHSAYQKYGLGPDGDTIDAQVAEPMENGSALGIKTAEWLYASMAPRCIVENYLFADVAQIVAPGGTGKTTIQLYEAVCIVLGRDLWGLKVHAPGPVVINTAEDRREYLVARLRRICEDMGLSETDQARVRAGVLIRDVFGQELKLTKIDGGNIRVTTLADRLIEAHRGDGLAMMLFDPLVSFGASETMVNENEQGLITALRRISTALDCCVRVIHHTGKANAREKTLDQYSGRGGSAMADGSRMTAVLAPWAEGDTVDNRPRTPPQNLEVGRETSVVILARSKLTYAPRQPWIWIARDGFRFSYAVDLRTNLAPEVARQNREDQVFRWIKHQVAQGKRWTARAMRDAAIYDQIGMPRDKMFAAIEQLKIDGRIIDRPLEKGAAVGARRHYLDLPDPPETGPETGPEID